MIILKKKKKEKKNKQTKKPLNDEEYDYCFMNDRKYC